MTNKIFEPVSVNLSYNSKKQIVQPKYIGWRNRIYTVNKLGFHHTYKRGTTLFHVFSVTTETLAFKLLLDTSTLHWLLEEVEDYA